MRLCFAVALLLFSFATPAAAQAAANPIGTGCPGTNGTPVLSANQPPLLGQTFTLQMTNLPVVPGFVFLVFGSNDQVWNGIPLPADLAFLGTPGCTAYVAQEVGVFLPQPQPTLQYSFPIPDWSFLLTCRLLCQGLVCDTGTGNGLGATTTNALELLFGRAQP